MVPGPGGPPQAGSDEPSCRRAGLGVWSDLNARRSRSSFFRAPRTRRWTGRRRVSAYLEDIGRRARVHRPPHRRPSVSVHVRLARAESPSTTRAVRPPAPPGPVPAALVRSDGSDLARRPQPRLPRRLAGRRAGPGGSRDAGMTIRDRMYFPADGRRWPTGGRLRAPPRAVFAYYERRGPMHGVSRGPSGRSGPRPLNRRQDPATGWRRDRLSERRSWTPRVRGEMPAPRRRTATRAGWEPRPAESSLRNRTWTLDNPLHLEGPLRGRF